MYTKDRSTISFINNSEGHFFEECIEAGCRFYETERKASIRKTPEPFRVTKLLGNARFNGIFTAHADPDFQGTLAGGKSIIFEAKCTQKEKLELRVISDKQKERLNVHKALGAITAVCCCIQDKYFFVPWIVFQDMKEIYGHAYVTAEDLHPYQVIFTGAVRFLEYKEKDGRNDRRGFF